MQNPVGVGLGLHTPRLEARQDALNRVFSETQMALCWKKYIRNGLRDQEVIDLFDYNDFHWFKIERFSDLRAALLGGRYKPAGAIPTKLEKKNGVCRTVVTPSPEDSLVLQCIVESLLPKALAKQPSKNAFFSRSHQSPDSSFQFGNDYIWFKQWRVFSKMRFRVASVHNWVATTDIATFFDNVQYVHLRNILSTLDGIDEVILDILFAVLDALCWRPDYLPSSGIGLPQVQFDAPRLLAHVYLYEIDAYLKNKVGNSFVRWVDDITFAAESREQCKVALRDLDILLQMRGLRLNSGKTHILSAPEARRFFHQRENDNLNRWKKDLDAQIAAGQSIAATLRKIRTSFSLLIRRKAYGQHDKIIKRYIGLAATTKSDFCLRYCLAAYSDKPELRDTIYWYIASLPPSKATLSMIEAYLLSGSALDDASQCKIAKVLTDWEVDPQAALFQALRNLAHAMAQRSYVETDTYRFVAALWMLTKYSTQTRFKDFVEASSPVWEHSEFLSRQVAAASGKFRDAASIAWFDQKIKKHSLRSALSVMSGLQYLRSFSNAVPVAVRMYVLNGGNRTTYTLQRFIVAFTVLSAKNLSNPTKAKLRTDLLGVLVDPHYRNVIRKIP